MTCEHPGHVLWGHLGIARGPTGLTATVLHVFFGHCAVVEKHLEKHPGNLEISMEGLCIMIQGN
jgi:hypothetical protein